MTIMEILTAILVVVTGIYAYLTYNMSNISERSVQMIKEQTEAMSRPYLIVQPVVRPHTPFLYLKIYNSGKTPALNVKLELDKDFYQFDKPDKNLKATSAFSSTFDSFAPNQELFFALGQGWLIFGKSKHSLPEQFVVTASYSYMDKEVVEKSHIDLRPFAESEGERNPIVEELEKIRKAQEKLAKKA
ncbi:hypothetical protein BCS84_15795 [Vibrio cyclitrophicus]|uniref:hypothetical protein n=1 Tax=Vibrio cyclitrophicus TaxID=47951 RepID=UPI0002F77B54|nr:hypothetical protein [Vibrio cyclitrophicus]OED87635.1 hypothetical protein OAQ_07555 [Vibrio cyclitrophicus ZF30]OEE17119.1 hypothetical protein OC1_00495 [Vibrio cyclitrophicus ZF207]OEE84927.1 hypothetical protein OAI_19175 [Vibrio cyclitrophicus FF160]PMI44656.1 hypothetical protein BCU44_16110 [Vibrio cyclitrophicus]PMJ19279.1 hypothetical protein BCU28_16450 [Vibrio cyclitrophicus]